VFVRGECVNFSPNIINKFLGVNEEGVGELEATDNQVSGEITANQVTTWPKKRKISSGKLSVKYAILNMIGAANWVPTTHSSDITTSLVKFIYVKGTKTKVDYGKYIFDHTVKNAKTDVVKLPIAFPTLLCNIVLDEHPGLITAADLPKKRESPLTIHQKLFGDNHVSDIVGTSQHVPLAKQMSKQDIVAALKETCLMLDERKVNFDVDAVVEDEEAESEKEVEDDDGSGNEEEEEDNNGDDDAPGSSSEAA